MTVTRIEGPSGAIPHLIPSAWWRDATTLCLFLDNPRDDNWLILTVDLRAEIEASQSCDEESM